MSAINVFVCDDLVHLITDGAGYLDGKLNAVVQKACILPHLNAAIAVRGPLDILHQLNVLAACFPSIETMERELPRDLPIIFGDRIDESPDHWHFDLVVAGVQATGPFAWLISSLPRPEHPAFELMSIPFAWGLAAGSPCRAGADGRANPG